MFLPLFAGAASAASAAPPRQPGCSCRVLQALLQGKMHEGVTVVDANRRPGGTSGDWSMTKKPKPEKNNENRENWQMQHGIEHDFAGFPLTFMTFYSKMESLRSLIWSIEQWKMIFFSLAEFGVVDPASLCFSGFAMGLAEGSCTDPDGWHKFALLQIYLPKTRAAKHQSARIAARPVDPANLVLHRRRDWLDSQFTPWSRIGFPVESMSSMWCGTHL